MVSTSLFTELVDVPTDLTELVDVPTDLTELVDVPTDLTELVDVPTDLTELVDVPTDLFVLAPLTGDVANEAKAKNKNKMIAPKCFICVSWLPQVLKLKSLLSS